MKFMVEYVVKQLDSTSKSTQVVTKVKSVVNQNERDRS